MPEEDGFAHGQHLLQEGAPPTRLPRFWEALAFAQAVLCLDASATLSSRRRRGAAVRSFNEKRILAEKGPLLVVWLATLEYLAVEADPFETRNMAGLLCLVAHTSARWSYAAAVYEEPKVDKDAINEAIFVAAPTARTRTSNAPSRRRRKLELAGRARGVSGEPGSEVWQARRRKAGLQVSAVPPLPQMIREQPATWMKRPLRTDEGCLIMKRLLTSYGVSPEDVRVLGTHSRRHTGPSWTARAEWPSGTRRSLGCHTTPMVKSTLECGMDELSAPLRALEQLRQAISCGKFDPDLTRAGRWAAEVGAPSAPPGEAGPEAAPGPGPGQALEDEKKQSSSSSSCDRPGGGRASEAART